MRKQIRDIIRRALPLILAAALLVGCATESAPPGSASIAPLAASDSPSASTSQSVPENSNSPESAPEPPAPAFVMPEGMHWAVEPALELDNLAPVTRFRGDGAQYYNSIGMITDDGLSEASKDGLYGLLDHDGNWVAPCEFDSILCGFEGKYALDQNLADAPARSFIFDENHALREVSPDETNPDGSGVLVRITGTHTNNIPCWVAKDQTIALFNDASVFPPYSWDEPLNYPVCALYMAETEGRQYDTINGKNYYEWIPDFNALQWVLYDGSGSVTQELYESIGCVAEGIVPAKKDGKYGYLDIKGNIVFPFEYDGSLTYLSDTGEVQHSGCMNATEGTVVLYKDGAYALYTVSGEEVIPFGVFEQLLSVHQGRLWAKADGKWGVLELEQGA